MCAGCNERWRSQRVWSATFAPSYALLDGVKTSHKSQGHGGLLRRLVERPIQIPGNPKAARVRLKVGGVSRSAVGKLLRGAVCAVCVRCNLFLFDKNGKHFTGTPSAANTWPILGQVPVHATLAIGGHYSYYLLVAVLSSLHVPPIRLQTAVGFSAEKNAQMVTRIPEMLPRHWEDPTLLHLVRVCMDVCLPLGHHDIMICAMCQRANMCRHHSHG